MPKADGAPDGTPAAAARSRVRIIVVEAEDLSREQLLALVASIAPLMAPSHGALAEGEWLKEGGPRE